MSDSYHADELRRVANAGPNPAEDFFRLQVSGYVKSKHLNITPEQLDTIIKFVTDEDDFISREEIIGALRDSEFNDSAADAFEWISDMVGWEAEGDAELAAMRAAEAEEEDA